ncbi:protein ORF74 [Lake sturgeon herpesvirus]|nr:protein ORF74 [Lake sturgeon herpesvirus]
MSALLAWVEETCKLKYDAQALWSMLKHIEAYQPSLKVNDVYVTEAREFAPPCYSLYEGQLMAIYVNVVTHINTQNNPHNSCKMSLLINKTKALFIK